MADKATAQEFDVLVLGGGSAGYAAALRSVQYGKSVALVEKSKVGGTCLHWGCIPTKAYLHAAEVADETRNAAKFGVNATLESVDMAKVRDYKDGIVAGKHKGLAGLLKMRKVQVIEGEGKLVSKNEVEVDGTRYTAENIVLASGSVAKTMGLPISKKIMTSTEALELDYTPKSAIVLGGGVIGSEFASLWNSFGVEVTIIEGLKTLVPNEDPAIIKVLEREFKKKGIKTNLGTFFDKVEETDSGVKVTLADGKVFEAEVCLVAVGRGPNTEGLGYEEQGVKMDRGFVLTDERLHTGVGNIYAVGDVVPGPVCSWRTAASSRASSWPRRSPATSRWSSRTSTSRRSPSPSRRSCPWATPSPRRRRSSARTTSRSPSTTWPATASPRSSAPAASSR